MSDDISDIIDDFAIALTAQRFGAGSVTDGRYTADTTPDTVNFTGSVTPASAKDLLRLPEGRRTEIVIRIITKTELLLLPQADVVTYNGTQWEVQKVDDWANVPTFYDCLAIELVHA